MTNHAPPWYSTIRPGLWRTLFAAQLGWMLDAMDVMLYAFALTAIRHEFSLDLATAGVLASVTLIASAFGGVLFGMIADKIGRTKALMYSILVYSVFTALTASSKSLAELILWRSAVGIGLGGEWTSGSVLVSETWPAEHRGKAIGLMQSGWALGYIAAAGLAALILPRYGWRVLFVAGVMPAFFTLWIRKNTEESGLWKTLRTKPVDSAKWDLVSIFVPPLLARTVVASLVGTFVLFAYWGLFTWIPTFLSTRIAEGGAGLDIVRSSGWIILMQLGAFVGYTSFGFLSDRFGRRPTFSGFLIAAAIVVPIYGRLAQSPTALLLLGPVVGFLGHGYFSVFGVILSELFPTRIRASAQGLCFNIGRGLSAFSPFVIGAVADVHGLGSALALTSLFFLAGGLLIFLLPETRAESLA